MNHDANNDINHTDDPQEIGSRMQAQSANANTQDRSHHAGGYDAEADLYKRDPTGPVC